MDAETYIADGIVASSLPVLNPMATRLPSYDQEADMLGITPDHVYACRMLDAASALYSKWFMVMKSAVSRERVRQRLYCEENGISVNTRIPYQRPILTAAEQSTVELCKNLIGLLFDTKVAEYAMLKFRKAVDTGDKRSFKIRLLVIKSRDSLKGTRLYRGFSEGAEECITKAERIAGCVPDPSPRRLSRSERARIEAKKRAEDQPMLFDVQGNAEYQSIDISQKPKDDPEKEDSASSIQEAKAPAVAVDNLLITMPKQCISAASAGAHGQCDASPSEEHRPIGEPEESCPGQSINRNCQSGTNENKEKVTVTKNFVTNRVTVTKDIDKPAPVRKTRVYNNTSEISSDIEAGAIVPYQTNEEVIYDISSGAITPAEAVLFLSELTKRKRSDAAAAMGKAVARDIDRRINASEDQAPRRGMIPMSDVDEEDLPDDEESDEVDDSESDSRFGDVDGGYRSSEAEWRPDDIW